MARLVVPVPLAALLTAALALPACSLDGLLLTELTRQDHVRLPDPAPVTLRGDAPGLAGAAVRLWAGDTVAGEGAVAADGRFAVSTDGRNAVVGAIVEARAGGRALLALVPALPAQASVRDPEKTVELVALSPGATALGLPSTTLALLLLGRARVEGKRLATLPPGVLVETLIAVDTRLRAGDATLAALAAAVARVDAAAAKSSSPPWDLALDAGHVLSDAFAAASGVDADGDGSADGSGAPFEALLRAVAGTVVFKACYRSDRIVVVLQARIAEGALNANCEPTNPYLWADQKPGAVMFVTGGVHPEAPRCTAARSSHCLRDADIDAINAALGNWVPNRVRMYDDGSHGDAKAGDGVWSLALEAPYWAPAAAPDGAGVRLAYKFTWGSDGQGWTGSEEFPGNQRILELDDRNGDALVVRRDTFGDETTNKDKANAAFAGCGKVMWPAKATAGCSSDAVERAVDLDGDCKVDGWPDPGSAAPLSVPCP